MAASASGDNALNESDSDLAENAHAAALGGAAASGGNAGEGEPTSGSGTGQVSDPVIVTILKQLLDDKKDMQDKYTTLVTQMEELKEKVNERKAGKEQLEGEMTGLKSEVGEVGLRQRSG